MRVRVPALCRRTYSQHKLSFYFMAHGAAPGEGALDTLDVSRYKLVHEVGSSGAAPTDVARKGTV